MPFSEISNTIGGILGERIEKDNVFCFKCDESEISETFQFVQ